MPQRVQGEASTTSRGAEQGVTASSLALGGLHRMELSPTVTCLSQKCGLECKPVLGQDWKSDGHTPESTLGQAVPMWKGGESLSAGGNSIFFQGK